MAGESVSNKNLSFQQGAHLVAMIAVFGGALYLLPREGAVAPVLANMAHILAFALGFGVQFWMTFINGVTIIKILPRPWFGAVQSQLFPKCFQVVLVSSVVMLLVNLFHQSDYSQWTTAHKAEVFGIVSTIVCTLLQLVYAVPASNELLTKMYEIEKEEGLTDKIGGLPDGTVKNPQYTALRKSFIKVHGVSALANVFTIACALLPAYHIAVKQLQ